MNEVRSLVGGVTGRGEPHPSPLLSKERGFVFFWLNLTPALSLSRRGSVLCLLLQREADLFNFFKHIIYPVRYFGIGESQKTNAVSFDNFLSPLIASFYFFGFVCCAVKFYRNSYFGSIKIEYE